MFTHDDGCGKRIEGADPRGVASTANSHRGGLCTDKD